jgi:hypothetical protein
MKTKRLLRRLPSSLRLAFGFGTLALWLGIGALPGSAQSLALAPAEVRYRFTPGRPFQFELSVSNDSNSPVVMKVNVTDFWYNDKNEKVFGPPGSSPRSAANWIECVPRQFIAPVHGTGKVKVVVTPPLQTAGGYYAVVFFESRPRLVQAATAERKAIYTTIRLGSLILLSAQNTETYKVAVSDVQFTPPSPSHAMHVGFMLANEGNTHVFPSTSVAIVDSDHRLIGKTEGEIRRFLPQQSDQLSVGWAGLLSPGSYSAILSVVYGEGKVYTQEIPFTISSSNLQMTAARH